MAKTSNAEPDEKRISRRKFLKAVAVSGGIVAAGSLLAACTGQTAAPGGGGGGAGGGLSLDLTKPENQALAKVGGTLSLDSNTLDLNGIFVIRTGDSTVKAYSRTCTHAGCVVGGFEGNVATCPCHGSQFDQTGNPVRGPAGAPLTQYNAAISGSTVTIS
jgi:Rieske Fe-S protein